MDDLISGAHVDRRVFVDVVVPLIGDPERLRRCVERVVDNTSAPYRLVLVDPSPGGETAQRLSGLVAPCDSHVVIADAGEDGWTALANRALAASRHDAVLLGADASVVRGWLDALRDCVASDARIATATPFIDDASTFAFAFALDDGGSRTTRLGDAADAHREAVAYPDIPEAAGVCIYLRRSALDALGLLDPVLDVRASETAFFARAVKAGWRNVLADDAFVAEDGAHAADALHEAARSRLRAIAPTRGVVHVIHGHGGGTERHVRSLIAASPSGWRHYLATAIGDRWQVEEHRAGGATIRFAFERRADESWQAFVEGLCATFGVSLLHVHNLSHCREGLQEALERVPVAFGCTVHDLAWACPTITFLDPSGRYCGGVVDSVACNRCLRLQPSFAAIEIGDWRTRHRRLVERASFLIAPSQWVAGMFDRYFPGARVDVIAHGTSRHARSSGRRLGVVMPADGVPVVAAIGAIGPDKGARRIERLVELMRERNLALRIVVIGYLDVLQEPWQSDDVRLTVHGRYRPEDLPDLLAHYRASLVLFPSEGPETFSYTLSEVWRAGMAVLVPPIGALAERVAATQAGFVMTREEWSDDARMLSRVEALVAPAASAQRKAAEAAARGVVHASPADMASATVALYERALARKAARSAGAFSAERVRAALGYVPWVPPVHVMASDQEMPVSASSPAPPATRIARASRALRHTAVGRLLHSIIPAPLLQSLKARLNP